MIRQLKKAKAALLTDPETGLPLSTMAQARLVCGPGAAAALFFVIMILALGLPPGQ